MDGISLFFSLSHYFRHLKPSLISKYLFSLYFSPFQYSEKTDVWAFGVTCYEIINREIPYSNLTAAQVSIKVVSERMTPSVPKAPEFSDVAKVMSMCFKYEAKERPGFEEICQMLGGNSNSIIASRHGSYMTPQPPRQQEYNNV